jgi:hypothetical protein
MPLCCMRFAEIDPVQIVIIVLAMLGGFVQWLWGLVQQAREERERRRASPPDPEERRLREEAWRRQVESPPLRPSPQAPRPVNDAPADPWQMVRKLMEKAQEAAPQPAPAPERPAVRPVSQPTRPPAPPEHRPAAPPRLATHPRPGVVAVEPVRVPVHGVQASVETAFTVTPSPMTPRPKADPLARLLTRPESVRQAVLLREILGPPKALQTGTDAPS